MTITLKCKCGALRGVARNVSPKTGNRVVCLCDDCQAFAHFLCNADLVLDKHGGTDIFQMSPSDLTVTQGRERLKCVRLSSHGLCRWYAGCCNTPIANTAPSHKVALAGVIHTIMDHAGDGQTRDAALGPIRAHIFGRYGIGTLPPYVHPSAPLSALIPMLKLMLVGRLKKRYTPSPFFDSATGKPVVEPSVVTFDEREALRKLCGPRP